MEGIRFVQEEHLSIAEGCFLPRADLLGQIQACLHELIFRNPELKTYVPKLLEVDLYVTWDEDKFFLLLSPESRAHLPARGMETKHLPTQREKGHDIFLDANSIVDVSGSDLATQAFAQLGFAPGFAAMGVYPARSYAPESNAAKATAAAAVATLILNWGRARMKLSENSAHMAHPEIASGLEKFRRDHSGRKTAFIMMQFSSTNTHSEIVRIVKETLERDHIVGIRADDKQYMDDLFPNVRVYMHACDFGIAIFERIEADDFNPNVSLEVGYMFGLSKNVLLLKDKTLKTLPTDLTGRLYREFDTRDVSNSIQTEIKKWLSDKGTA